MLTRPQSSMLMRHASSPTGLSWPVRPKTDNNAAPDQVRRRRLSAPQLSGPSIGHGTTSRPIVVARCRRRPLRRRRRRRRLQPPPASRDGAGVGGRKKATRPLSGRTMAPFSRRRRARRHRPKQSPFFISTKEKKTNKQTNVERRARHVAAHQVWPGNRHGSIDGSSRPTQTA